VTVLCPAETLCRPRLCPRGREVGGACSTMTAGQRRAGGRQTSSRTCKGASSGFIGSFERSRSEKLRERGKEAGDRRRRALASRAVFVHSRWTVYADAKGREDATTQNSRGKAAFCRFLLFLNVTSLFNPTSSQCDDGEERATCACRTVLQDERRRGRF
jgi:hypothetical protein